MADVFLSYTHDDDERVRAFAADLNRFGWTVWWDDRIRTGAEFDEVIERELDLASCVIVVWSRSSVASGWVRAEASAANEQGKLVPVRFESDVVPPLRFRQLNTATLETGSLDTRYGDALRLLAEIARLTGRPPAGVDPVLLDNRSKGTISGAQIVTPGTWRVTSRVLGSKIRYDMDLQPNGMVSGRVAWFVSRTDFAGRWMYDAAHQVLQLEASGGGPDGFEVVRFEIAEWIDDNTASCRFKRRKALLARIGG